MNCQWVRDNLDFYLYGELGDGERHELEQHVARCSECEAELADARRLHEELNQLPTPELTPNLLAMARMQLQEALEGVEPVHGWRRLFFDPIAWLGQSRLSPALAGATFLLGFGVGLGAMYQMRTPVEPERHAGATIAGVRTVEANANGGVSIEYERVLPEKRQGSLDDPAIQELLLMAAKTNYNSGVRMDSVELLKKKPDDGRVREGLVFSLRYDSNPGVRLKALEALQGQVLGDVEVRNAMLEALLNDNNPGVRIGALHALEQAKADTSVHQALQKLAAEDPNSYIRQEAQRLLHGAQEME